MIECAACVDKMSAKWVATSANLYYMTMGQRISYEDFVFCARSSCSDSTHYNRCVLVHVLKVSYIV